MADGTGRTLNTAERGYSTIEKEALAIIFGEKKFHQFLYGRRLTIQTDHKPLEDLLNEKKGAPNKPPQECSDGPLLWQRMNTRLPTKQEKQTRMQMY